MCSTCQPSPTSCLNPTHFNLHNLSSMLSVQVKPASPHHSWINTLSNIISQSPKLPTFPPICMGLAAHHVQRTSYVPNLYRRDPLLHVYHLWGPEGSYAFHLNKTSLSLMLMSSEILHCLADKRSKYSHWPNAILWPQGGATTPTINTSLVDKYWQGGAALLGVRRSYIICL